MTTQDLHTSLTLIRKDFNLDEGEFSINETELTTESLLQRLTKLVSYLLEKDFSKLLHVLYRIDISEERLKAALASNEGGLAIIIARMILEREMQKVETRKKYSS